MFKISNRRLRPSPSMAVAFVALLLALGGTSYAALRLPAKSVGNKQLRNQAVTGAKIKNNSVTSAKVRDNSLTGADVNESTLGKVRAAETADKADTAGTATSANTANRAGGVNGIVYKTQSATVPGAVDDPADPDPGGVIPSDVLVSVACDPGAIATGGGAKLDDPGSTGLVESYPNTGGTGWSVRVNNDDLGVAHGFVVTAVCVPTG